MSIIFGGENRHGIMTAKKSRDLLPHSISPAALNELQAPKKELHGYIDIFLDEIRLFEGA